MITRDYEEILNQIVQHSSKPKEEIELMIKNKILELQDLISKEGAAHIVANELNVKLFQSLSTQQTFKIKDILPGFNSINLLGKVVSVYEVRTYQKQEHTGRVASMLIGDETGAIRVTVWDEKLIDEFPKIKEGDIIKIANSYSRKNNNNYPEVHLGSKSSLIINPPGEDIKEVKITHSSEGTQKIANLKENEFSNVFATIVDIFEPRYYEACPSCNKKVLDNQCKDHGSVTSNKVPILNFIIDDGTSNIRVTAFRDVANELIKNETLFEKIKENNLGKQVLVRGRLIKNEAYNTHDFTISSIKEPAPEEVLEMLSK